MADRQSHTLRTVITIAFWKPYDVLSQFSDRADPPRATLADYIDLPAVYGAGRLDRDSEGLLILSEDTRLRTMLTEPRHETPRTYWAQVEGIPDDRAVEQLRSGVMIKGKPTLPAKARRLEATPELPERSVPIRVRKAIPDSWLELQLTEGRNRQVRRMTAAVGHPTLRLVRWSVGSVTLKGLSPGSYRELDDDEVANLVR
ncbi:MAG: pseudouridine synthase [Acidimicrobiales bacterium]